MNKTEHLLVCLAEECAEVQQAVAKALRFGLDDGCPGANTTNAQDIARECCDLIAVIELLEEASVIKKSGTIQAIEVKKAKVRNFMEYAKDRGTLVEDLTGCGGCCVSCGKTGEAKTDAWL